MRLSTFWKGAVAGAAVVGGLLAGGWYIAARIQPDKELQRVMDLCMAQNGNKDQCEAAVRNYRRYVRKEAI